MHQYPTNKDLYYRFYFDPDGWCWVCGWGDLEDDNSVLNDSVWNVYKSREFVSEVTLDRKTIAIEHILCDMFNTDSVRGKMFDISFENYCKVIDLLNEIERCEAL